MIDRALTAEEIADVRENGLLTYWCPICKVGTGSRAWHSLRDGGLIPQNDTEHDCVRVDVGALLDGHPLYAAREALTGKRFRGDDES